MQWRAGRAPAWRAAKPVAFAMTLGVPLVLGLALSAAARSPEFTPDERLLLFLLRAFTAPLFVLIHFAWMRAAVRTLEAEGALKP